MSYVEVAAMKMAFPGMDPYLEHPVLWESVHARLITTIADQLQPRLDPRYVATIEERVFIEGPRIPDVWLQQLEKGGPPARPLAVTELLEDAAVVVEVDNLEIHQKRVEILDLYNGMKVVAMIEVVSPTNKVPGPGRKSYRAKQREALARDCHLVEIDLLRRGRHVLCVPRGQAQKLPAYDYLLCVNRWPYRNRFTLYPRRLRERLPRIRIPLADPDPDVLLDVQEALEQVYENGRYRLRIRYQDPCKPPLPPADQEWANQCWAAYRAARPEPARAEGNGGPGG